VPEGSLASPLEAIFEEGGRGGGFSPLGRKKSDAICRRKKVEQRRAFLREGEKKSGGGKKTNMSEKSIIDAPRKRARGRRNLSLEKGEGGGKKA